MLRALVIVTAILSVALIVAALWGMARDALFTDRYLLLAGLLEVAVLALAVTTTVQRGDVGDDGERATMLAYAWTLPFVPPALAFFAIKEKTRFAMGIAAGGAFTVGVMAYRVLQIWTLG